MKLKNIIGLIIFTTVTSLFQPIIAIGESIENDRFYKEESILEEKLSYIETYYSDLDEDGIEEKIEIVREAIKPGYISYYVYDLITEDIIFSKKDIYRGVIDIDSNRIIEKTPIFKEDNVGIQTSYEENEYVLKDGNIVCINSNLKEDTIQAQIYSNKTYSNPSRVEIETIIDEVALDKGIPPTILKAIAYTESNYRQFDKNGQPLLSFDGVSWGIMQVTPKFYPDLDLQKLKYDTKYNIEAGADILLGKWGYAFSKKPLIPRIGKADMRVLENWYFAIWAYNGLSESNNPNLIPYQHKTWTQYEAYQDKVLRHAKEILNQDIVPISKQSLPSKGIPDGNMDYRELNNSKEDKYRLFVQNQRVKVNVNNGLKLRNSNMEAIKTINNGDSLNITGVQTLYNGYWYYEAEELYNNGRVGQSGWVASNWILPNDTRNKSVQVWQKKINVENNKIWTIKFNLPVEGSFNSQDTIYIEDSRLNKVPIRVYYDKNNYNILKVEPVTPLDSGGEYILYIKGLKTNQGNLLNENIKINFNVRI